MIILIYNIGLVINNLTNQEQANKLEIGIAIFNLLCFFWGLKHFYEKSHEEDSSDMILENYKRFENENF